MTSVTTDFDPRVEIAAYLLGIPAVLVGAHRAGATGDWVPLMAAVAVTGLLVVLFDGE